jgi:hypothetical protein
MQALQGYLTEPVTRVVPTNEHLEDENGFVIDEYRAMHAV